MPSEVFKIENGVLAFALVDPAAVGYTAAWQAPGGKSAEAVALADYTGSTPPGSGGDYTCQVTSGALNASSNTTTDTTPATFCGPEVTTTVVGVTSYALDATILQDPHIVAGVSRYLFEHDTKEAYFYLGLSAAADPPKAIGRVRLVAGAFGGDARVSLTATLSLPVSSKPDIEFGDATASVVIKGDGTVVTPTGVEGASEEEDVEVEDAERESVSA